MTVLADPAADLHPTRREAAGSDGVFVGRIRADLAEPHAVLFGSVADAHGRHPERHPDRRVPPLGIPGLTRQLTI